MAKRTNHLDWSQKLFVACFCTGALVLGAGGAVKASRMMGGPAADATEAETAAAPASRDPDEDPPAAADSSASADEGEVPHAPSTPAPTATPEPDADHQEVAAMAKPDKPGEHGDEKDPAREAAKPDGAEGGDALPESQRRAAYAALARAKASGDDDKADEAIAAYASANGISKSQLDDIAEEGKIKGWSDGGEAKGDVDADAETPEKPAPATDD